MRRTTKSLTPYSLKLRARTHQCALDFSASSESFTNLYISHDLANIILQYLHPVPYYSLLSLINKQWRLWVHQAWRRVKNLNFSYVCYNEEHLTSLYRSHQLELFKRLHPQLVKRLSDKERLDYKQLSAIHSVHAMKTCSHLFNAFVVFLVNQILLQANGYESAIDDSITRQINEDSARHSEQQYLQSIFVPKNSNHVDSWKNFIMTSAIESLTFSDIIFTKDLSRVIRYFCPNLKILNVIMCHVQSLNGLLNFPSLTMLNLCGSQINDEEFSLVTGNNRWIDLLIASCNASSGIVMSHDRLQQETRRTIPKNIPKNWRDLFTPQATTFTLKSIDLRFTPRLRQVIPVIVERFISSAPVATIDDVIPTNILRHRIEVCLPTDADSMLSIFTQYAIDGNTPTVIEHLTPKQQPHITSSLTLVDMNQVKAYTCLGYSMRSRLEDGNTVLHFLLANIKANMHLLSKESNRMRIKDDILFLLRHGADIQCKNYNQLSCIQIAKQIDDNLRVLQFLEETRPSNRATISCTSAFPIHDEVTSIDTSHHHHHHSFKIVGEKSYPLRSSPKRKRGNTHVDQNYNGEIYWNFFSNDRERQRAARRHFNINPDITQFSTSLDGDYAGKVFESLLIANATGYNQVDQSSTTRIKLKETKSSQNQ